MHRHSPYCKRKGKCRFGYDENSIVSNTYIDETSNRVVYRRREEEDLKVVPYNPRLTKEFKAHINVERTQGGGAVAYLMKYAFKPPKPTEVRIQSQTELSPSEANSEATNQNDIREYMRARRIGSVEAAWRLLEFRNVAVIPKIEKYAVYLPGERKTILRNPNNPPILSTSPLERYFLRPSDYTHIDFLTYMEIAKL